GPAGAWTAHQLHRYVSPPTRVHRTSSPGRRGTARATSADRSSPAVALVAPPGLPAPNGAGVDSGGPSVDRFGMQAPFKFPGPGAPARVRPAHHERRPHPAVGGKQPLQVLVVERPVEVLDVQFRRHRGSRVRTRAGRADRARVANGGSRRRGPATWPGGGKGG